MDTCSIFIKFNRRWKKVLEIPTTSVTRMSTRPIKWLRFLCYIIVNSEGRLFPNSHSADSQESEVNYDSIDLHNEYYYLADRKNYLLADPGGLKTRGCTSAGQSLRSQPGYHEFAKAVSTRDNDTCRFSGVSDSFYLDKVHLVPYSKGSEYLQKVVNPRASRSGDHVDDISDVRNGILLGNNTHRALGAAFLSFLRIPNLYMTVNDIDAANNQPLQPVNPGESYLILQWLKIERQIDVPHNTPARRPTTQDEMSQWPAAVIIDFMYASAAIRNWGTKSLHSSVLKHFASISWERDRKKRKHMTDEERKNQDNEERNERASKRLHRFDEPGPSGSRYGEGWEGWDWLLDGLLQFQLALHEGERLAQAREATSEWLKKVENEL